MWWNSMGMVKEMCELKIVNKTPSDLIDWKFMPNGIYQFTFKFWDMSKTRMYQDHKTKNFRHRGQVKTTWHCNNRSNEKSPVHSDTFMD